MKHLIGLLGFLFVFNAIFVCESAPGKMLQLCVYENQELMVSRQLWLPTFPHLERIINSGDLSDEVVGVLAVSIDDLRIIDDLLRRSQNPENYSLIYQELIAHFAIENLLTSLFVLQVDERSPLCHLVAQAFAHRIYRNRGCDPGNVRKIYALFKYFEENYSPIAHSLKMYVYLGLKRSERMLLNSYLSDLVFPENFLEQVPTQVVQFAEYDSFSVCFSSHKSVIEAFEAARDYFYAPFERYYGSSLCLDDPDEALHSATKIMDSELAILAIRSNADINGTIDCEVFPGRYIPEGVPPLWKAVLLSNLPMVRLLIGNGANPLQQIERNIYEGVKKSSVEHTTILESALSLYRDEKKSDDMNIICSLLLHNALCNFPERLKQILEQNESACDRAYQLLPALQTFLPRLALDDSKPYTEPDWRSIFKQYVKPEKLLSHSHEIEKK